MADWIVNAIGGKFAFNAVAWATCAVALWAAALNHEAFNDTVKGQSFIRLLKR